MLADSVAVLAAHARLKKQEANAYSIRGYILCSGENEQAGYEAYSRALQIRASTGDSSGMAAIYNNVANFKQNDGEYETAIDTLRRSIQLLTRLAGRAAPSPARDTVLDRLTKAHITLSNILDAMGSVPDIQHAISAAHDAIRFASLGKNAENLADARFCLANRYYSLFQFKQQTDFADSCLAYYDAAIGFYRQHPAHALAVALSLHNQAVVLTSLERFEDAALRLDQSEKIYRQHDDSAGVWNVLIRKGALRQSQGHYRQAMPFFREAMTIPTDNMEMSDLQYFCELMSEEYENLGDPVRALAYQKRAFVLRDSILNENVIRKSDNLKMELASEKRKSAQLETERIRSKNKLVTTTSAAVVCILVLILFFTYGYFRERAAKNLLRGLADGTERTLRDLSDRLHTEVQSELSRTLRFMQSLKSDEPAISPALEGIRNVNAMIRDLSHDLSVTVLKYSTLWEVLEEYCEKITARKTGVEASFGAHGILRSLPGEVDLALYRIAQSCVNNTFKHANARQIAMSLEYREKSVVFEYSDDGKGFDYEKALSRGGGIGLRDMAERVALLDGVLKTFVPAGGGAGFSISIPVPASSKI